MTTDHPRTVQALAILDGAHLLRQMINRRTSARLGITVEQALVLCVTDLLGERATMTRIATAIRRTQQSATSRVKTLESRHLVVRLRGQPGDKRETLVKLTEQGHRILLDYREDASRIMERAISELEVDPDLPIEFQAALDSFRQWLTGLRD